MIPTFHKAGTDVPEDWFHPCPTLKRAYFLQDCYSQEGRQERMVWPALPITEPVLMFEPTEPGAVMHIRATRPTTFFESGNNFGVSSGPITARFQGSEA